MLIPIAIFVVCLCAGVAGAARWLPPLAEGPVGGLAFFAVCGLLGSGLAVAGLRIYLIVEQLEELTGGVGLRKGDVLADGIAEMLFEAGALFGLALVVYLLAPRSAATAEPEAWLPTGQPS
jgi:hypothetical protein